jgi:ABC-2 type transport system ATP-binding protein
MIELKNLKFGYKKKLLFENLDLNLKGGNIYGLLGMNGAGKTTLLKIISGQLFIEGGEANVLGFDPQKRSPHLLKEIFYLPEEFFLPNGTVEAYLSLNTPYYPRFDRDLFNEYARTFNLDLTQKTSEYSFGQKKKFLLAFGLASDSKLLILDEPTNGLDIPSKSQFRKTVASALTDERSFVISTHQVRDMDQLIDPLVILHEGKVILNNTLEEVAQKITMTKDNGESEPDSSVIYSEKVPGGYFHVSPAKTGSDESALDMEILFNGVVANPLEFSRLLKGGRA